MRRTCFAIVLIFLSAAMFSEAHAQRAVAFFEMLRHTDGQFYNQPFVLLPWQKQIIRDVYGTLKPDGTRQYKYVYLEIPKKNGKALDINTLIPTPDGWARMGDLNVGDRVFDENGRVCNILAATDVMTRRPCYRITFDNGQKIIADADHQWLTTTRRPEAKTAIRTSKEIAASTRSLNGLNHRIEINGPVVIPERNLPIAPYLLGLWLGDGNSRDSRITIADEEPLEVLRSLGYELKHRDSFGKYGYWVTGTNPGLRSLNLFQNKHIPELYLFSSIEQRLELLRGLMDSDGYCSPKGQCEFCGTNRRLATDVVTLVRSLGMKATLSTGRATLNGKDCGEKYRAMFNPNADLPVFHIQRKMERQSKSAGRNTRAARIYIESCELVGSVPVRCIQVDSPSRMYLASESFIPTHNSELAAGAALYHLFADGEHNGEIYGCAADRGQASIVYKVAADMIDLMPALAKRAKVLDSAKKITDKVSGSVYQVLSADAFRKHGFKVSACIFDELHAQPNRALWDVMTFEAGATRAQPIWWIITTAGEDPDRVSICWEQHEYALKVLAARNGTGDPADDDPTWYPVIYGYDGDDIWNEDNWFKANPSLGKAKSLESMRETAHTAKRKPEDERKFRWLDLNQWVTTKLTTWLPVTLFDQTVGSWSRADLLGKDCYLGIDLSSTTDLTTVCGLFPPQGDQLDWRAIWHCWIPEENMKERIDKDHVPYDKWVAMKHVTATPGNVVDYTEVEKTILEMKKFYNVLEVPSDRAFAAMLMQRLEQQPNNMVCVDIPQTFKVMTAPMGMVEMLLKIAAKRNQSEEESADLETLKGQVAQALGMPSLNQNLLMGGLTHENNLVARWCFGNASIAKNGNAEIKLVKEHKGKSVDRTKRIDLMTALVNAMARAQFYQPKVDLSAAVLDDDWGM